MVLTDTMYASVSMNSPLDPREVSVKIKHECEFFFCISFPTNFIFSLFFFSFFFFPSLPLPSIHVNPFKYAKTIRVWFLQWCAGGCGTIGKSTSATFSSFAARSLRWRAWCLSGWAATICGTRSLCATTVHWGITTTIAIIIIANTGVRINAVCAYDDASIRQRDFLILLSGFIICCVSNTIFGIATVFPSHIMVRLRGFFFF